MTQSAETAYLFRHVLVRDAAYELSARRPSFAAWVGVCIA
jgi:hypothetical protein